MSNSLPIAADGCIIPDQRLRPHEFVVTAEQPCPHHKVSRVEFTIHGESEEQVAGFVQKWLMSGPMHKMIVTSIRRAS